MTTDAIVIGGGPAGLLAAIHLARAGRAVTLLEAGSALGGRAATERRDGFDLNRGPHALYRGGPAERELAALGIDPPGWNPASWRSAFVREGRARRTPGATARLGRWLLLAPRRASDPALARMSAGEWLSRTVAPPARDAAGAVVRLSTFVADHDALSADVAALQLAAVLRGVRYVDGGWQTLVDALAAAARDAGATLRTGTGVRTVERDTGGWRVRLDTETLRADAVVVATGTPADARALLGDRAPSAPGPAAEVSVLDLGLSRLPRPARTFVLGIDEPTYAARHTRAGDRPLVTVATYGRQPRERLERLADDVQPGWRERLLLDRHLPRMAAVSAVATPATGGLSGRPAVDRGDGLALAGDWVGPEGWLLDAALASGAAAARAVLAATPVAEGLPA